MDAKQRRVLTYLLIIVLIFGFYFLRDYFSIIALGAIVAFLFNPVYKKMLKTFNGNPGLSAMLTLLIAIFTVGIPTAIVLAITVNQAVQLVDSIRQAAIESTSGGDFLNSIISFANSTIDRIPGHPVDKVNSGQIVDWLKNNSSSIVKSTTGFIVGFAGGFTSFLAKTVIFVFVFLSFLKNQGRLLEILRRLNPLHHEAVDLYLSRMKAMTKAMVKGQFVIAILAGLVDAFLIWITGIPYFMFWFVFLTFLSVIPLGGGIVVLPVGIIMLLTGRIWEGLLIIIGHLVIVTNIDNVLRPRFVPKKARLDSALTILSVFAGLAMFGFLGIVIGPVLMIIIVTTIEVYVAEISKKEKAELIEANKELSNL